MRRFMLSAALMLMIALPSLSNSAIGRNAAERTGDVNARSNNSENGVREMARAYPRPLATLRVPTVTSASGPAVVVHPELQANAIQAIATPVSAAPFTLALFGASLLFGSRLFRKRAQDSQA